jgi:hypothetical protein
MNTTNQPKWHVAARHEPNSKPSWTMIAVAATLVSATAAGALPTALSPSAMSWKTNAPGFQLLPASLGETAGGLLRGNKLVVVGQGGGVSSAWQQFVGGSRWAAPPILKFRRTHADARQAASPCTKSGCHATCIFTRQQIEQCVWQRHTSKHVSHETHLLTIPSRTLRLHAKVSPVNFRGPSQSLPNNRWCTTWAEPNS